MSPPEKAKGPAANRPPNTATITWSDDSTVVLDMAPASVTIPPAQIPLQLAVNTLAFEREPIHWWLRTPQGAAQVAFLRAMGWWAS